AAQAPNRTARSPKSRLATMFKTAFKPAPSSKSELDSKAKVENVVYDPTKPTATASRKVSDTGARSRITVRNHPRNRLPVRLITNVPMGNSVRKMRPHRVATAYLATAPRDPAAAIARYWASTFIVSPNSRIQDTSASIVLSRVERPQA